MRSFAFPGLPPFPRGKRPALPTHGSPLPSKTLKRNHRPAQNPHANPPVSPAGHFSKGRVQMAGPALGSATVPTRRVTGRSTQAVCLAVPPTQSAQHSADGQRDLRRHRLLWATAATLLQNPFMHSRIRSLTPSAMMARDIAAGELRRIPKAPESPRLGTPGRCYLGAGMSSVIRVQQEPLRRGLPLK